MYIQYGKGNLHQPEIKKDDHLLVLWLLESHNWPSGTSGQPLRIYGAEAYNLSAIHFFCTLQGGEVIK